MTAYDRQQQILKILQGNRAQKLGHLPNTWASLRSPYAAIWIRLKKKGVFHGSRRRRAQRGLSHPHPIPGRPFPGERRAKRRIARRAADMVKDGDRILLDESTTVFHMVPYLRKRNHLTIVTNGVETGLALSRDTSHTVILLGGGPCAATDPRWLGR